MSRRKIGKRIRKIGKRGDVNLRGRKKIYTFSCGCCWCEDNREIILNRIANKELKDEVLSYNRHIE